MTISQKREFNFTFARNTKYLLAECNSTVMERLYAYLSVF
jgi:hypothetical protein